MEAWLSWSVISAQSSSRSGSKTPPLASKHEEYRMVSSVPRNSAMRRSSSAVDLLGAADESHGGHPVSPAVQGRVRGLDHARVGRQARGSCWRRSSGPPARGPRGCADSLRVCDDPLLLEGARAADLRHLPLKASGASSRQASSLSSAISRITFPQLPDCMASKPLRNSANGNRWVRTGQTSSPLWSMVCILYQVSKISRP